MSEGPAERPNPAWLLDEVAAAGQENLDASHVARYDEKEDAHASEEVALLRGYGLNERSLVVDLGAGTGQFTIEAARVADRVIAVDISPVMVARLRNNVAAAGLPNVDIIEAGFLTYRHQGPPADVVYSRWSLHHLPDFWKALALHRMRETLVDGGVLRLSDIVFSFAPAELEGRVEAWASSLPAEGVGGEWVRSDIDDHIRDEHSTFTWLLEPMIERAGFTIDQATYSDDGFYAAYIARPR